MRAASRATSTIPFRCRPNASLCSSRPRCKCHGLPRGTPGKPFGRLCQSRIVVPWNYHTTVAARQANVGLTCLGPPGESALRQPFGAQPESLAVVEQDFECRGSSISEDIDGAPKGIVTECEPPVVAYLARQSFMSCRFRGFQALLVVNVR